ncbi:hypothetical protein CK203_099233 [Vitis vinifera]|uniref:Uncharacterized protein n=1 Tax=Vitis vinifera TaxID=29760 RepID=A0A438CGY8_VITVI|nr:hypothetical protein CK203_099233 [Vitis vinifera]
MADKTIGGCVRNPVRTPFAVTWITRDARPQHWRRLWELSLIQSPVKDGHTFPKSFILVGERKIILNGVEPSKEDNWQASDN